jgi:hypothetical protein
MVHITSADQVGMRDILTVLTHKKRAFVRGIDGTAVSTPRACLTRVVRIDPDRHTLTQQRLTSNHGVQFGTGPLRPHGIGVALLEV